MSKFVLLVALCLMGTVHNPAEMKVISAPSESSESAIIERFRIENIAYFHSQKGENGEINCV